MKTTFLPRFIYLFFLFLLPISLFSQVGATVPTTASGNKIPVVKYEQGEIVGSLPYGRHFYVQGSTLQPGNTTADRIVVEFYNTGKFGILKRKKTQPALSGNDITLLTDRKENLVSSATWNSYESATKDNPNPKEFNVYINTPLKFSHRYLMKTTYHKIFNYVLTDEEKKAVIKDLKTVALQHAISTGQIVADDIQNTLNDLVVAKLLTKITAVDKGFYDEKTLKENIEPVPLASLEKVGNDISQLAFIEVGIKEMEDDLKSKKDRKGKLEANDPALASLNNQIKKNEKELTSEKAEKTKIEATLEKDLQVIKNQILIVKKEYAVGSSHETSVTELQTVQIGSSFGGGLVGLNYNDTENRDYDAFSYTALKFYFLPVDKRIADPYLDNTFLLNRLSFIFGVATKGKFNYNGIELDKVFAVTPIVGLGYDFSRYFSIDVGITAFKQQSVSPFSDDEKIRIAPMLGLNFDIDVFNRFSSLFTGDKYSIKPAG